MWVSRPTAQVHHHHHHHHHHDATFIYADHYPLCGCWHWVHQRKEYLPLVTTRTHATILSSATHTRLEQTFANTSPAAIERCVYEFPLYDGVSVTDFTCTIGTKTLVGVVNERHRAKATFEAAVAQGQTAGLLEQDVQASDVFRTTLGNIPAGESVQVRIQYVGELKQDVGAEGLRLTIPSIVAPRYGDRQLSAAHAPRPVAPPQTRGMDVTVDINLADGAPIRGIESPSHPIAVSLGTLAGDGNADPVLTKGSATLSFNTATLDKDFVLLVKAKNTDLPRAILERHPTLANQRALMTTLVPRFELPLMRPEVVFVADRSGSMQSNIPMLKQALNVFLRSMPTGVKFNICSFGTNHTFLWKRSQSYTKDSLEFALSHVETFAASYGGTETLNALQGTIDRRYGDIPLEIILLTDGDVWSQELAFNTIAEEVKRSKGQIRLFPLGIGSGVSHALIEGLARAGNGFSQSVQEGERMDDKVVRMLKGALTPHVSDYTLEVVFGEDDDDFELVEKVASSLSIQAGADDPVMDAPNPTISLFNPAVDNSTTPRDAKSSGPALPDLPVPVLLQAPAHIPALYPFIRTTAYVLIAPSAIQRNPVAVVLRAMSAHGPLELRIPVTALDEAGKTIHCLAARKATQDLEEGRGWLHAATNREGKPLSEALPSQFPDLVEREAVRLGETFQVANRWCSFVAVEGNNVKEAQGKRKHRNEPEPLPVFDEQPDELSMRIPKRSLVELASKSQRIGANWYPNNAPLVQERSSVSYAPSGRGGSASRTRGGRGGIARRAQSRGRGGMMFGSALSRTPGASPAPPAHLSSGPSFHAHRQFQGNSVFANALDAAGSAPAPSSGTNVSVRMLQRSPARMTASDPLPKLSALQYNSLDFSGDSDTDEDEEDKYKATPKPKLMGTKDRAVSPDSDARRVLCIIDLQEFDGHWSASTYLASLITMDAAQLAGETDVRVTALVIAFLETKMQTEEDVWEMIVDKARDWLASVCAVAEVMQWAHAILKS